MPRARSRRVINRANSIIIARAGERYVSGERRTYAFNCSFSLSLSLSLSLTYTDSFLRCRNIGEETFAIAHIVHRIWLTIRNRLSLVKTRPGAFPWIKSQQFYTPSCFLLLSSISSHAKDIIYNSSVMYTPGGDLVQNSPTPPRVYKVLYIHNAFIYMCVYI